MRKWSAIFFSILLVLSLSACGQADKDNETGNRNSQVSAEKNKNNTGSTSSNTRVLIAYFIQACGFKSRSGHRNKPLGNKGFSCI